MISLFSPPAGGELCEAFCTRSPERFLWVSLSKKSRWAFSPSCFPNCKINFCIMILQFCRCGGLFDAKGNPDGFLSHFSSLRNFRLGSFLTVLLRAKPGISLSFPRAQRTSDFVTKNQYTRFRIVQKEGVLHCLFSYEEASPVARIFDDSIRSGSIFFAHKSSASVSSAAGRRSVGMQA